MSLTVLSEDASARTSRWGSQACSAEKTELLMKDKKISAIFEAGFTCDNIHVRVDILERLPRNKWHLIEVKSTNELKDYHLPDVAI